MELETLAQIYPTDKMAHGYLPYYKKHLPESPNRILEIGCLHGDSIRMWKDYFPNTEIHCLDLFIENPIPEIKDIVWWKGSQVDEHVLNELQKIHFDVIIDDGSHISIHQVKTFFSLIGNCSLYVCEDIFCCNEEFYRNGMPFKSTLLGMMKQNKFPFNFKLYEDKIAFITK